MYLAARDARKLKPGQAKLAEMAEIIVRASAKVGIVALVDEATGYQKSEQSRLCSSNSKRSSPMRWATGL